jgi:protein TonB
MIARQTLAAAGPFPIPARPRRDRAASLGIVASIAVHLAIVGYLLNATFHPFQLAQPADPPAIIGTVTLDPTRPLAPPKPIVPRVPIHAPRSRPPSAEDVLPVRPLDHLLPDKLTVPPLIVDATPTVSPPQPPTPTKPATITNPAWVTLPDAAQMSRVYPERAARLNLSGEVTLTCAVTALGGVEGCRAISETPAGYGFAHAAMDLTAYFRMKPRTENGQPVGGATVLIPIRFAIPPGG